MTPVAPALLDCPQCDVRAPDMRTLANHLLDRHGLGPTASLGRAGEVAQEGRMIRAAKEPAKKKPAPKAKPQPRTLSPSAEQWATKGAAMTLLRAKLDEELVDARAMVAALERLKARLG